MAERGEDKQEPARKYLQQDHQFTHLGVQKLQNLLREQLFSLSAMHNKQLAEERVNHCAACQCIPSQSTDRN